MPTSDKNTSNSQVLRVATTEAQKSIFTAIPGHVLTFDPKTQRAQIQIGIVRVDINNVTFEPKPIVDVPVSFAGGDFTMEFEINPGDEGIVLFSQRCIDGWKQTGGVADNPIGRFHHQQDAMFIPGIRSQPNVITNFQNNGIRLRNKDGTQNVWLKKDKSVEMNNGQGYVRLGGADGTIALNGVTIDKNGNMSVPKSLKVDGKELDDHVHNGVAQGTSNTGPNQ